MLTKFGSCNYFAFLDISVHTNRKGQIDSFNLSLLGIAKHRIVKKVKGRPLLFQG